MPNPALEYTAKIGDQYMHEDFGIAEVVYIAAGGYYPIRLHCTDYKAFICCDVNGMQFRNQIKTKLRKL